MPPAFDRPVLVYYAPRGESPSSLALMRRIDELFMKYPFYGSRQMVRQLRRDGVCVGRHRVRRLMRLIGPGGDLSGAENQRAASHAPDLSLSSQRDGYRPAQSGLVRRHHLYPRPAWLSVPGSDHGLGDAPRFILAAVEHHGTLDSCAEALGDALARYGQPEIFNTDQGSQFTSLDFTGVLKNASIRISMDGRGRCMDNIFIERLWRSLKYEAVLPTRAHRRLPRRTGHRRVDRLLQHRAAPFVPRRSNAGRGLRGRSTCGYDGQGSRLAHIPTGSTTATGCDKKDFGSMIKQRNTP